MPPELLRVREAIGLRVADRRVSKPQPTGGQSNRRHEKPVEVLGALQPVGPGFRGGVGGAALDPETGSRSGSAFVPRGTPSGKRGSICQVAQGQGLTLQPSRRETLEKARN